MGILPIICAKEKCTIFNVKTLNVKLNKGQISKIVNECVKRIFGIIEENAFDYIGKYEEYGENDLLFEFLSDKENGIRHKQWNLIPARQYYALLQRFMQQGEFARIPYNTVYSWIDDYVLPNLIALEYMTRFAGHSSYFPGDAFEDAFGEGAVDDPYDYLECDEYLESIGFYEWCKLPDGSDAWSDYGLEPIWNILKSIPENASASDLLIALNRILDVTHSRGDLSSAFIEGGRRTLSAISSGKAFLG